MQLINKQIQYNLFNHIGFGPQLTMCFLQAIQYNTNTPLLQYILLSDVHLRVSYSQLPICPHRLLWPIFLALSTVHCMIVNNDYSCNSNLFNSSLTKKFYFYFILRRAIYSLFFPICFMLLKPIIYLFFNNCFCFVLFRMVKISRAKKSIHLCPDPRARQRDGKTIIYYRLIIVRHWNIFRV